ARVEPACDGQSGAEVAGWAEAMQLPARIDRQSGSLQGAAPLQRKPMNRDQVARMREKAAPPAKPIRADKVNTGPIQRGSEPDPVLQPMVEREGIRRGELKDNLPHLLAAFYNAKETGELGLMKGQVKKIIFFESGFPVFALSNLVADRLGQFLVRAGKIDEQTMRQAADEASSKKQ